MTFEILENVWVRCTLFILQKDRKLQMSDNVEKVIEMPQIMENYKKLKLLTIQYEMISMFLKCLYHSYQLCCIGCHSGFQTKK